MTDGTTLPPPKVSDSSSSSAMFGGIALDLELERRLIYFYGTDTIPYYRTKIESLYLDSLQRIPNIRGSSNQTFGKSESISREPPRNPCGILSETESEVVFNHSEWDHIHANLTSAYELIARSLGGVRSKEWTPKLAAEHELSIMLAFFDHRLPQPHSSNEKLREEIFCKIQLIYAYVLGGVPGDYINASALRTDLFLSKMWGTKGREELIQMHEESERLLNARVSDLRRCSCEGILAHGGNDLFAKPEQEERCVRVEILRRLKQPLGALAWEFQIPAELDFLLHPTTCNFLLNSTSSKDQGRLRDLVAGIKGQVSTYQLDVHCHPLAMRRSGSPPECIAIFHGLSLNGSLIFRPLFNPLLDCGQHQRLELEQGQLDDPSFDHEIFLIFAPNAPIQFDPKTSCVTSFTNLLPAKPEFPWMLSWANKHRIFAMAPISNAKWI